jgi:hypothetical protein
VCSGACPRFLLLLGHNTKYVCTYVPEQVGSIWTLTKRKSSETEMDVDCINRESLISFAFGDICKSKGTCLLISRELGEMLGSGGKTNACLGETL